MPDLGYTPPAADIDDRQPELLCHACAEQEGHEQIGFPQWFIKQCDACGRKTAVTSIQYFIGLRRGWEERIVRLAPPEEEA